MGMVIQINYSLKQLRVINMVPAARRRSGVFIVNFEHNSYLVLVFLLLTWNM